MKPAAEYPRLVKQEPGYAENSGLIGGMAPGYEMATLPSTITVCRALTLKFLLLRSSSE